MQLWKPYIDRAPFCCAGVAFSVERADYTLRGLYHPVSSVQCRAPGEPSGCLHRVVYTAAGKHATAGVRISGEDGICELSHSQSSDSGLYTSSRSVILHSLGRLLILLYLKLHDLCRLHLCSINTALMHKLMSFCASGIVRLGGSEGLPVPVKPWSS